MKDLFKINDAVSSLSKGGGVRAFSVLGKKSALSDARSELPKNFWIGTAILPGWKLI